MSHQPAPSATELLPLIPPQPPNTPSVAASGAQAVTTTVTPAQATAASTQNLWSTFCSEIEKLRDGNWFAWKTRITIVLESNDAYDIVTGAVPRPQDPSAVPDWRNKDLIAQALIATTIKDEQVIHIAEYKTSAQMWTALRAVHEPLWQRSIFSTIRMLYRAQAKETTNIPTHLSHMRLMRERLRSSGHIIDDLDFKYILVDSLPHSWEAFTTSYLGYQGGIQVTTAQELISLLCEEYYRRKEKEESGEFACTAAGSHSKSARKCKICGRNNHVTNECRFKGKPKRGVRGKFGHRTHKSDRHVVDSRF